MLYGQWYLAWYMLGRKPVPFSDDARFIAGAGWMHHVTRAALVGLFLLAPAAVAWNLMYIFKAKPTAVQAGIRLQTLLGIWLGVIILICTDPYYPVMEWWLSS